MKQALIVDDHPIVRAGLRELLQKAFPSIELKESSGADGTLTEVCGHQWEFVILDINLPGRNGIDILKRTRICCPQTPIIVFSFYPERQFAARALQAGAAAYLSKERSPQDFVGTVKMVLEGELRGKASETVVSQPVLSHRESQVLTLLVNGMGRREISRRLRITEGTVSAYRGRLLNKLNVRSQVELVRYAVEEGWLTKHEETDQCCSDSDTSLECDSKLA